MSDDLRCPLCGGKMDEDRKGKICFVCETYPARTRPVLVGARYDPELRRLVADPDAGRYDLIPFDVPRGYGKV